GGVAGLEADLDMIEAGLFETCDPVDVHADAGGDEVTVVAEPMGLGYELFEIAPNQRLAAGKTELHGTERARLAQHAQPVFGSELVVVASDIEWVGAIRALQRAAISQFGEQPQWLARKLRE